MKKKILKTITEHNLISEGMHIVLGLSGGPDSMCLFSVLTELAEEMNLTIHPVHVNHKFRPGAAEEDQAYVEKICRDSGLHCRSFVYDCSAIAKELGLTPEEAGRKVRYEAFFKTAEELRQEGIPEEKIAVAVAQNANDQCETILFRILRGTGTDGLAGIAYERGGDNGIRVIRPLLDATRDEIEKYCAERNLNPRIDHTNSETVYTRNRIRLELIPYLKKSFNENIIETVNRMGRNAAEDRDYLDAQAAEAFEKVRAYEAKNNGEMSPMLPAQRPAESGKICIFIPPLEDLHPAIRFRVYNMALSEAGMKESVTRAHIEAAEKVRLSESPSAAAHLADGYRVYRTYDRLVFEGSGGDRENALTENADKWQLTVMSRQEFGNYMEAHSCIREALFGAFSGRVLESGAKPELRTRRDGDVIAIKGGTKKLQDFFTDAKVPKLHRDDILLLAVGSKVLWVLPSEHFAHERYRKKGRFSADFKADPEHDETIIVLEQKKIL